MVSVVIVNFSGFYWTCAVQVINKIFHLKALFSLFTFNCCRNIFVHGFALDSQGRKMSKSEGNVVDPITITDGDGKKQQAVGIDVLR